MEVVPNPAATSATSVAGAEHVAAASGGVFDTPREPLAPIDVPLAEFPRDEAVPEGCVVLDDIAPSARYALDYRELVYCTRMAADGSPIPLRLYALVPCLENPLHLDRAPVAFPVVMYCQGSAWHKQWIHSHFTQHVELARRGFVVVSVEYRPSDVAPFPAQAQDFSEAVRYVREHAAELDADPARVALWGDSSGAHTALMTAYADGTLSGVGAQASCVVDWYGPTDLASMSYYPSASEHVTPDCPEGMLLGGRGVLDEPKLAAQASPLSYVRAGLPPTLIMHGARDELVPFNQSCRLYERLRETGNEVVLYKLPDANHGKAAFTDLRLIDIVEAFLREHL